MKILVISDTHGYIDNVVQGIKTIGLPDMIFHLGDNVEDGIRLRDELNIPTTIVRGNGDYNSLDFNDDEIVELNGKKIFLSHGHNYNVNFGLSNLYYKAQEVGADYVLFGHTHIPIIERTEKIVLMNPGSPVLPRGYKKKNTVGILLLGDLAEEKIIEIK
ncbi:metallophosphoesterase [Tissierella sp.]|uniref:metallophosphoesterase n=1 Tax=Tissierella sp. TaxID=41274 RepID=UPI002855233D|nr:metallophosphoesterase [Tissierella sp.]MDR7856685.1 metallophosphoesterase [Tissierella sp.]